MSHAVAGAVICQAGKPAWRKDSWRPILVSPIGVRGFFSARGLKILGNEALWAWCPALILFAVIKLLQQRPSIQAPDSPLSNTQN